MKKLMSWILALALCLSLVPMSVLAADRQEGSYTGSVSYVNPVYAAMEDQEDQVQVTMPAAASVTLSDTEYLDEEECVAAIQQNLLNHQSAFTVTYYYNSSSGSDAALEELSSECTRLFSEALEHNGTGTAGDYLMWSFAGYSCGFSVSYQGSNYYVTYNYVVDFYTTASQETELTAQIQKTLNELIYPCMSDYEKVCAIYDYITLHVVYDYNTLNDDSYKLKYTAYAAMMNRTAVCQGYATLFYRMALEAGLDCRVITGTSTDLKTGVQEAHAWNIVKLGDSYYNLDATWDSSRKQSGTDYIYFLKSMSDFSNHNRDSSYATNSFNTAYPMASANYDPAAGAGTAASHSVIYVAATEPTVSVDGHAEYWYCRYCGKCFSDEALTTQVDVQDLIIPALGTEEEQEAGGTCGESVTWTLYDNGTLTIRGTGAMEDYSITQAPWITLSEDITSVVVEDGVSAIGEAAFEECRDLTSVVLASTVTDIGDYAFQNCTALTELYLGSGLKSIGRDAFYDCSGLTSVTLPEGLMTIGTNAFYCCSSLTEITVPDTVTAIGDGAFYRCTSLTTVSLGSGVTSLGQSILEDCTCLTEIQVADGNRNYCASDGILFNKTMTSLVVYPAGKTDLSYQIPDGVLSVEPSAFYGSTALTSVTIPSSVTTLGASAFGGCTNLATVLLGSGITAIGAKALDCAGLQDLYYGGTEEQWAAVRDEGGSTIAQATIHYNVFSDVTLNSASVWYYLPMTWSSEQNVVSGRQEGTTISFAPFATCSRAEFVTMLYNLAGKPVLQDTTSPFSEDEPALSESNSWYYNAMLWAYQNKITTGQTATTFAAMETCTRAEVVTFIYRFYLYCNDGTPVDATGSSPFEDAENTAANSWFYDAMIWAKNTGVTTGRTETTFAPFDTCMRCEVVTFLYRYDNIL